MSKLKKNNELFFNLNQLNKNLGGKIEKINGITTLQFDNLNGKGRIRHLTFDKGLVMINVDVMLNENLIFDIGNAAFDTLHFIFCLEGHCSHFFGDSGVVKRLNELQSTITETNNTTKNSLFLRPKIRNILNIICVDKHAYFTRDTKEIVLPKTRLTALLKTLNFDNKHIHLGKYNVKIGAYVKELLHTDKNNKMTEQMHFEGISHLIFASHIEELYNESLHTENASGLTTTELKKIQSCAELIIANPHEQHTVSSLCELTNLSPAKLQLGCKALNNRTISDFVRYVRLKKAEELIKTTDLNISEIVYSIGFTSRSYFCKIFKNEYGRSPKAYKKAVKDQYFVN